MTENTVRIGSHLGPYEIVAAIGAGGMGEVYKARDTRLDRSVAIKILPPEFAQNAQLKIRFEREAKTISQLTHPNICTLHDIGNDSGVEYLVMELLDGETLADRLAKGPLPIEQVLRYGAEIAEALDQAHRAGVVHRDLKPGNVMLTKNGAKLLDFGLAKPSSGFGMSGPRSPLPNASGATIARPLTEEGTIVGTFQYMAPEQIEGADADSRTDVFALGCVLYEMATGHRAFDGKTRSSLIAAIVGRDPVPMSQLVPLTPPAFEHVVSNCMEKEPDARWQSAHDIAEQLRWIGTSPEVQPLRTRRGSLLPWLLAALTVIASAVGFVYLARRAPLSSVLRFDVVPPEHVRLLRGIDRGGCAISPDGTRIAFVGRDAAAVKRLYVRLLSEGDARPLPNTEGAALPFWSPDSRSIAFFANGKLVRIGVDGNRPAVVTDNVDGRGGAWAPDGTILFAPSSTSGLVRVAADGGGVTPVTHLNGDQSSHRFPCFLPDGKNFVYYAQGSKGRGIFVASLDGRLNRRLIEGDLSGVFAAPSHLLFGREDAVMAQAIDLHTLQLSGSPVEVGSGLSGSEPFNSSDLSVSRTGTVAYPAGIPNDIALVFRDRAGIALKAFNRVGDLGEPSLAPDEKSIVATIDGRDLWQIELERGHARRVTFSGETLSSSLWSPDGQRVAFAHSGSGKAMIEFRALDGSRSDSVALPSPGYPESFTPDGKMMTFSGPGPSNSYIISTLTLTDHSVRPLISTAFKNTKSRISPDGKLLAYTSDESGRPEVFVQTFPLSGAKWQISTAGGDQAQWRKDGKEIFFLQPDGKMMSVAAQRDGALSFSDPVALFQTVMTPVSITGNRNQYLVMGDGQRFLLDEPGGDTRDRVALVMNWQRALERQQ